MESHTLVHDHMTSQDVGNNHQLGHLGIANPCKMLENRKLFYDNDPGTL